MILPSSVLHSAIFESKSGAPTCEAEGPSWERETTLRLALATEPDATLEGAVGAMLEDKASCAGRAVLGSDCGLEGLLLQTLQEDGVLCVRLECRQLCEHCVYAVVRWCEF